jgi:membrane-bound lytic murein transglycosylase D
MRMNSFRATLIFTFVSALLGCSHDLHYNYSPPHPPSQVLDLSSIQEPMTLIEQPPKEIDLPQIQEKPKEIIPETEKADEPVQKKVTPQKKRGIVTEHEINSMVQIWIERLSVKDRAAFKSSLTRLDKIRPTMERIFKQYGIPKEMVYLCLVESNANPHAVSSSGATGYWQFIPDTAKKYGLQVNKYVDERKHLEKSTHAAAQYLKYLNSIFGDWYLAIAAYNAGEGAVIRLMKNHRVYTFWDINNSMGIKAETIDYVPKYIATVIIANNRSAYGLSNPPQGTGPGTTPETVDSYEYLGRIAQSNGSLNGSLALNNPEFITDTQLVSIKNGGNKIGKNTPKSSKKGLSTQLDTSDESAIQVNHTVHKGDTLYSLARKYSSTVDAIAKTNRISPKQGLTLGKTLIIPSTQSKQAHAKPTKYKVKKGDTLWGISKQFDVSTMDILRWNQLTSTAQIKPGDKLTIYHQ